MAERIVTARIVEEGDSQMVLLPEDFRLPGTEVQVSWRGRGLLLEPVKPKMSREEIDALLGKLHKYRHIPFMENGREQPPMPDDDDIPSLDE